MPCFVLTPETRIASRWSWSWPHVWGGGQRRHRDATPRAGQYKDGGEIVKRCASVRNAWRADCLPGARHLLLSQGAAVESGRKALRKACIRPEEGRIHGLYASC